MQQAEMTQRENWRSRFGFIMAAAGSAIGLGNIWRFPYLTGEHGGSAFIIIYLLCIVFVGLGIMIGEFAVGRKTSLAAVGAYKTQNRSWTFAGALGVLSGFFIMGFYPVVGGWSLAYMVKSITGLLTVPEAIGDFFGAFVSAPVEPLFWMILYLAINVLIVAKGVAEGIEAAGKVLMPTLFLLLIFIIFRSVSLPGAGSGLSFNHDSRICHGSSFDRLFQTGNRRAVADDIIDCVFRPLNFSKFVLIKL